MTSCCCFVSNLLRVTPKHQLRLDASSSTHIANGPAVVVIQIRNTSERFFYHLLVLLKDAKQTSLTTRQTFRLALYRLLVALVAAQKTTHRALEFGDLARTVMANQETLATRHLKTRSRLVKRRCEIRADFMLSSDNDCFVIIRTWSSIVLEWLNKRVKYECYGAFLSTLGGAYSSLGEDSVQYAKQAESISIKQLALARAFNDPNAVTRCKLFLSFSYIQLGKLQEARALLKTEYKLLSEATTRRNQQQAAVITDERLRVMCIAGIKKLRFVVSRRCTKS